MLIFALIQKFMPVKSQVSHCNSMKIKAKDSGENQMKLFFFIES